MPIGMSGLYAVIGAADGFFKSEAGCGCLGGSWAGDTYASAGLPGEPDGEGALIGWPG